MMAREKNGRLLLLIIAGLLMKLAVILTQESYADPHTWEYEILARNLVEGVVACAKPRRVSKLRTAP